MSVRARSRAALLCSSVVVLAAALTLAPAAGAAAGRTQRLGHAASVPRGARGVGALSSGTTLDVTVALQPRDPSGLADFATAVSTPGNPDYHHYLTVQQFAQTFGATRAGTDAVLSSLRSHGLDAEQVSPNGLSVSVSGTAAQIAQAFSVSFTAYAIDGHDRYSADQAPAVDSAVAGDIQSLSGFDDLAVPTPAAAVNPPTGGPEPTGSNCPASAANWPDQLATQYDLPGFYRVGDQGAGQTVAILEYQKYTQGDIDAFAKCLGISDSNVAVKDVNGGSSSDTDGSPEAALDIETVLGLAPKSKIQVFEAPNTFAQDIPMLTAIVSSGAQVVSTSWGACESATQSAGVSLSSENTLFEEAATQGQSWLSSAGDDGSAACYQSNSSQSVAAEDPSAQPFVTGVGGTELTAGFGTPGAETTWNEVSESEGAGGGGYSSFWQEPSYQSNAAASLRVPSDPPAPCVDSFTSNGVTANSLGCREVPDVSADADPESGYEIYWGGWQGVGGTSAAAPLWAAFIALANDSSGPTCAQGSGRIGFLNPALYSLASTPATYARDFNDVTTGNNNYHGDGGYTAGAGYDLTTGLGTPNGSFLAGTLCGDPVTLSRIANQSTGVNVGVRQLATASPSSGVTYSDFNLPAGVTLSSSGTFSGAPTTVGTSYPTVIATNAAGQTSAQTFTWTVTQFGVSFTTAAIPSQNWTQSDPIAAIAVDATDNQSGTVSYSAAGLPTGLSINPSSGAITGTPTSSGSGTATITATSGKASSSPAMEQFSWTVSPTTIAVASVPAQTWTVGTAVGLQLSATDSGTSQTPTFTATGLPAGLSVSSTGLISGTPTAAQSSAPVVVTATDGTGASGTTTFGATVGAAPAPAGGPGSSGSGSAGSGSVGGGSSGTGKSTTSTGASKTTKPKATPIAVGAATATGTATSRPKLVIRVTAASGLKLKTVTIHLPSGFSASRIAKRLKAGITVTTKGAKVTVSGSTVTITLAATTATITIGYPDLSIAKSLISTVKKHRAKAESVAVTVRTTANRTVSLTLRLTPR